MTLISSLPYAEILPPQTAKKLSEITEKRLFYQFHLKLVFWFDRYTNAKIYARVQELLGEQNEITAKDYPLMDDHDYLTAIHLALYSTDYRSPYTFETGENSVTKGRYAVPNFTLRRKGDNT